MNTCSETAVKQRDCRFVADSLMNHYTDQDQHCCTVITQAAGDVITLLVDEENKVIYNVTTRWQLSIESVLIITMTVYWFLICYICNRVKSVLVTVRTMHFKITPLFYLV